MFTKYHIKSTTHRFKAHHSLRLRNPGGPPVTGAQLMLAQFLYILGIKAAKTIGSVEFT